MEPIYENCRYGAKYWRTTTGWERWWEYNEEGKLIRFRDSNGRDDCWDHDENGRMVHFSSVWTASGKKTDIWWEYDESYRTLREWDSDGNDVHYAYDEDGDRYEVVPVDPTNPFIDGFVTE